MDVIIDITTITLLIVVNGFFVAAELEPLFVALRIPRAIRHVSAVGVGFLILHPPCHPQPGTGIHCDPPFSANFIVGCIPVREPLLDLDEMFIWWQQQQIARINTIPR